MGLVGAFMNIQIALFSVWFGLAGLVFASNDLPSGTPPRTTGVDFYKEEITLTIKNGKASVEGIYYFQNNTDKPGNFPIVFPFYIDSFSLFPRKIKAFIIEGKKNVTLDYKKDEKSGSIILSLPLKPKAATIWRLDYTQKIKSAHARYILTSTGAWGKPLIEASYRFIVPVDYDSVRVWPKADSISQTDGKHIMICHKKDFLPGQDLEIYWQQK